MVMEFEKQSIPFFNSLLTKTDEAYYKSEIKENDWGYSVTATRLDKGKPVIVGFNWGVDNAWLKKGNRYGNQKDYPNAVFKDLYNDLGSFKKVVNQFNRYLPEANEGVQINFCFFRSQTESQISQKDLDLCIPLFEELIAYLEPNMIILFSSSLFRFFKNKNYILNSTDQSFTDRNRTVYVSKGQMLIKNVQTNYYLLPHPNYPISGLLRMQAWEYCFGN